MASYQTSSSILHYTTTKPQPQPLSAPTSSLPSSSSSSQLPSAVSENSNDSRAEVGSMFAYEPHILAPFMGLQSIDRPNDPWHHKAFDLHRPLFTGGGSYERYLQRGRYKRDLTTSASAQAPRFAKNRNTLTPEMLGRILHIKSNFKKYYPGLYNTMMGQFTNGKSTKISITPPQVPQQVSHKNLELAAAEINPLESLIHTYEEDLKRITELQKEQQENGFQDSLLKSYKNEFNFWSNPREEVFTEAPITEVNFVTRQPETSTTPPVLEETSFWEDPQTLLKQLEEEQKIMAPDNQLPLSETTTYTGNLEDVLKPLAESQLIFQNPSEERVVNGQIALAKNDFQNKPNDESLNFWENPQEVLKDLTQLPVVLSKSEDTLNDHENLWKATDDTTNDADNHQEAFMPNPEVQNFESDNMNVWEEPSALQKRNSKSFWTELEAEEDEQKAHKKDDLDDSKPIFDFDEDFE